MFGDFVYFVGDRILFGLTPFQLVANGFFFLFFLQVRGSDRAGGHGSTGKRHLTVYS